MRKSIVIILTFVPCALLAQGRVTAPSNTDSTFYDLVIVGARVFYGSGNPWFYGDVAVRGGRIARVGRLDSVRATRRIDAKGKAVIPVIIDLHSHADDGTGARGGFRDPNASRRAAPNLVMQGVTTVVVNQDGRSPLPIAEQRATIERLGIGPNTILLVGHGSVRARVMGSDFRRAARPHEIAAMRELVRQRMRDGAWGLSAGFRASSVVMLDGGVISVENAIRSMTSLPAQVLGLRDRGMIREGMVADIAVIDLNTIRDKATFFEPHLYAEGVEAVWVNGIEVVAGGKPTWSLPGRVPTKTGARFQP